MYHSALCGTKPVCHAFCLPLATVWVLSQTFDSSLRQGYFFEPYRNVVQVPMYFRYRFAALNGPSDVELNENFTRESTMREYLELKQFLLKRTQRFGSFLTIYILLVISAKAALCTGVGACAGYLYTALLCRDIDNVTVNDDMPMMWANRIYDTLQRRVARTFAGLQQQAQPRLLVCCHS
jgi:hypothetical protein